MKKVIGWISFLLSIVLIQIVFSDEGMYLTVRLNKNIFKVGDDFQAEIIIKNNTHQAVRILPWQLYDEYWFQISDIEGKIYPGRVLAFYELDGWVPHKDSFIVLPSGKAHVISVKGRINKTKNIFRGENYSNESISISFFRSLMHVEHSKVNSSISSIDEKEKTEKSKIYTHCDIPLPKEGVYYLQARFEPDDFIYREAKIRYGFQDMWQGRVVSEKIKFTVSE